MKADDPGYFPGPIFFFPDMHETRKMGILIGIIYTVKPVIAHLNPCLEKNQHATVEVVQD